MRGIARNMSVNEMRPTETADFYAHRLIRYTFQIHIEWRRLIQWILLSGYFEANNSTIRLEFVYLFCIEFVYECRRKERTKCGERKDSEKYVVNVDTDDNNTCERMNP